MIVGLAPDVMQLFNLKHFCFKIIVLILAVFINICYEIINLKFMIMSNNLAAVREMILSENVFGCILVLSCIKSEIQNEKG
jgi:hypothetical protein